MGRYPAWTRVSCEGCGANATRRHPEYAHVYRCDVCLWVGPTATARERVFHEIASAEARVYAKRNGERIWGTWGTTEVPLSVHRTRPAASAPLGRYPSIALSGERLTEAWGKQP